MQWAQRDEPLHIDRIDCQIIQPWLFYNDQPSLFISQARTCAAASNTDLLKVGTIREEEERCYRNNIYNVLNGSRYTEGKGGGGGGVAYFLINTIK